MKYKLTDSGEVLPNGEKAYRIEYTKEFSSRVGIEKLGGFVESEYNLSQQGDCFISDRACAFDNSRVFVNAKVCGNAIVYDNAYVYQDAYVYGYAKISGNSRVYGDAVVYDNAWVFGDAKICWGEIDSGWVREDTKIGGVDPVEHPEHYTDGGIETIDIMEAKLSPERFKGFLQGNSIKYLLRAGKKDSELQDIRKARWYINKIIDSIDNK